ncbi:MAG: hypothetical protein H6766_06445 [Candidatus Peribacteria bacterium]|nr:MAG: hypothetical protein H6766_06445 [Candidatus Peribacteria bacterium]
MSEAFYFGDPEGNGIELYYDRDPSTWQWNDGTVTMGSNYLDVADYVSRYATPTTYDDSMGIGHIHLQVGDLVAAKEFYVDIL